MPSLAGLDVADAGQRLQSAGLRLFDPSDMRAYQLERRVSDPPAMVLEQFPAPGTKIPLGAAPFLKVVLPPDPTSFSPPKPFLVGKLEEDVLRSAEAYYDAIDPGPVPTRGTLADWKKANGFGEPSDDEAVAIYWNRADLGFGRYMHMRRKGNHVAFYVDNYPTIEDAIANTRMFATVAMEWSPPVDNPSSASFTKFYTFDGRGRRILDPALDTHGVKLQPGVCLPCHGGSDLQVGDPDAYKNNGGNLGASFVPFDLDSLGFSSRPGYTRADQELQFKKLNMAVKVTYQSTPSSPVFKIIEDWYGGPGMPNDTFDGSVVPDGWNGDSTQRSLYLNVFAKSCRACHYPRQAVNFATYAEFNDGNMRSLIRNRVFDDASMPLSEKGNLNFWLSSPSQPAQLAQWLGIPLKAPGSSSKAVKSSPVLPAGHPSNDGL
jgi:hypothetical protein